MAKNRTPAQRARDRALITELLMQGRNFTQIQKITGLSTATVSADLQALRTGWADNSQQNMRALVQQETQRFDFILSQMFDELARLKDPQQRLEALEAISRTAGRRCRVLGISADPEFRRQEQAIADSYSAGMAAVLNAVLHVVKKPESLARIADLVDGRTVIDETGKEI